MKIIKILLLLITASTCCHAQFSQKRETSLRDSMFHFFYNSDSCNFQRIANTYKDYVLTHGRLHLYYTAMSNEVVFYLNAFDYYTAYVKLQNMDEDMTKRNCEKERYQYTNMMGNVMADLGKKKEAMDYLLQTIDLINQCVADKNKLVGVYMDIAYCQMGSHPDESLKWAMKAEQIAKDKYNLSDATAMISELYFILKDYPNFLKYHARYMTMKAQGYISMYNDFLEVYWLVYHKHTNQAVAKARVLQNQYDRYYYEMKVYEYVGDIKQAYIVQSKMTEISDSLLSSVVESVIYKRHLEQQLEAERNRVSRNHDIFVSVMLILAVIFCVGLVGALVVRKEMLRKLNTKNKDLIVARDKAMESDRMKLAFIRNVSHQIRTPLNIISGYSEVLTSGIGLDADTLQNSRSKLTENVKIITEIFDKLIRMSESESEILEEAERVSCNDLLTHFIASYQGKQHKDVTLCVTGQLDETEDQVNVQVDTVQKILHELMDNAIKFTERGCVELAAKRTADNLLMLTVQDTGCGVPPAENEHIFERFVKLDDFAEGTGLGLTLCRSLCTLIGGTIVLDNAYVGGARFILTIPC